MKSILITLTLIIAAVAVAAEAKAENEPKVIALRMYADWCGYCKQLDPKVDAIKAEYKGKPVLFAVFDQTDDFAIEQTNMLASLTGFEAIQREYEGRTGLLLLIDPETGEILEEIDHSTTPDAIKASLDKYLQQVEDV